ncbi:MAG: hypothetical protein JSS45_09815 [Proteobacteria bacterium]|nr:hypothetical protein [Pseudomonadota bacterium]
MQVEAIYRQGKLELLQPIHFKNDGVRLVVIVPNSEVEADKPSFELPDDLRARAQAELDRYRAILDGPMLQDIGAPDPGTEYENRLAAIKQ